MYSRAAARTDCPQSPCSMPRDVQKRPRSECPSTCRNGVSESYGQLLTMEFRSRQKVGVMATFSRLRGRCYTGLTQLLLGDPAPDKTTGATDTLSRLQPECCTNLAHFFDALDNGIRIHGAFTNFQQPNLDYESQHMLEHSDRLQRQQSIRSTGSKEVNVYFIHCIWHVFMIYTILLVYVQ